MHTDFYSEISSQKLKKCKSINVRVKSASIAGEYK